jgi:hypothetical protein
LGGKFHHYDKNNLVGILTFFNFQRILTTADTRLAGA